MALISCFIVCCNEETSIRRCLESVSFADEIIIIDSGSTDRTLEICREFTDKIIGRPWEGYVNQKRFGLSECQGEWVLNIDADEEVSEELKAEIQNVLKSPDAKFVNGYLLSRVVFYLNRWWRSGGWYPEYRLRLCRREACTWGGIDPHEKAEVSGKILKLKGELHHYTFSSISDHARRLDTLSSNAATALFENGKSASLFKIFFNPPIRFIKWFFIKQGFKEGFPGFIAACLESHYVFLKYVKLWELYRNRKNAS